MPGAEFSKKNKTLLTSLRDAFTKFFGSLPEELLDEETEAKEAKSFAERYDLVLGELQKLSSGEFLAIDSIYDTHAIFSKEYGKNFFAIPYSIEANTVSLGDPTPVFREVQYLLEDGTPYQPIMVVSESMPIALMEVAGKPLAKIINEGQGSSLFYPKEVLMQDGPKVFKAGTQMFLNHATAKEQAERPEGDIKNLAAVTTEDAKWMENGPAGPALYAPVLIFDDHKQMIMEKAPHTGLSINAFGDAKMINGRLTLTAFNKVNSVDFVTRAGREGQLLLEAQKETVMDNILDLEEMNKKIATLAESIVTLQEDRHRVHLREAASSIIHDMFQSSTMPAIAIDRVRNEALKDIPIAEGGDIDVTSFKSIVNNLAVQEGNYLSKVGSYGVQNALTLKEDVSEDNYQKTLDNVRKKLYGA